MGGSCIGKIPRRRQKKQIKDQPNPYLTDQVNYIELLLNSEDVLIQYPSYDICLALKNQTTQSLKPNDSISILEHFSQIKLQPGKILLQQNFLSTRLFDVNNLSLKKYLHQAQEQSLCFQDKSKNQQIELWGEGKYYQLFKIQLYKAHIFNIFLNNVVNIPYNSQDCLSMIPNQYHLNQIIQTMDQVSKLQQFPKKIIYFQPHNQGFSHSLIQNQDKLKQILKPMKKQFNSRTILTQNIFFNGFYFHHCNKNQASKPNRKMKNLLQILGQHPNEVIDCHIFLYANPLILQNEENTKKIDIKRVSSYLQIKSFLDIKVNSVFNLEIYHKNPVYVGVYLLILSLKIIPALNKKIVRQDYIEKILKLDLNHQCCEQIQLFLYLGFISMPTNKIHQTKHCMEIIHKIFKDIFLHPQILIDALFIEFGLEIDEKKYNIRKNAFAMLNLKNSQLFCTNKRFSILPDQTLILDLVSIKQQIQHIALNTKALTLKDITIWQDRTVEVINKRTSKKKNFQEILQHYMNKKELEPNKQIILEYLIGIKIYELFVMLMISPTSKKIGMSTTFADELKTQINLEKSFEIWTQILQSFNRLQFCSGELAITVLSLHGIVRGLDNEGIEGEEGYYIKAFQIWCRIFKDPRVKYQFHNKYWVILIIQNLINCLKNNVSRQNRRLMEDISYLQNILQAIEVNLTNFKAKSNYSHKHNENFIFSTELEKLSGQQMMKWIIFHIPIKSISSIFYHRLQLAVEDEKGGSYWMKTGGSIFDTPTISQNKGQLQELLSQKSNYESDLQSNGHSGSRTKTKKSKMKKIHQLINSSNYSIDPEGIVQWGKGISSIPMPNPYIKDLDVLKIASGNYHVVIATTQGIFGWGDNSSGQLGQEMPENQTIYKDMNKQFKKVRKIHQMNLRKEDQIQISCGNEHTAVLINKKLRMWGQKEGGILGGDGEEFDQISCGGLHTLGIRNGKAYSWGRGEGGQLGHKIDHLDKKKKEQSTQYFLLKPTQIACLDKVKKCVCGDAHSVVLTEKGEVYVFGFSYQGQLGLGLTGESEVFQVFEPTILQFPELSSTDKIIDVFAGSTFTFLKTNRNEVFSCGMNDCFQLGIEKVLKVFKKKKYINRSNKYRDSRVGEFQFSKPRKLETFKGTSRVNEIYCGENHCVASINYIQDKQMIMGWGLNRNYQISCEFPAEALTPRTIDNLFGFDFEQICCGSTFTIGLVKQKQENHIGLSNFQERVEELLRRAFSFIF